MFLFITGVSCVGKTTIGNLIAQKLGIEFHSVDYHVSRLAIDERISKLILPG